MRTALLLAALWTARSVPAQTEAPVPPRAALPPPPAQAAPPPQTPAAPVTPAPAAVAPAPAPLVERLAPLDPAGADLAWNNRHWQLVVGGQALKDFGTREVEARQALRAVQGLHLTQHGTVGPPQQPVLEYWLSDGHAPEGSVPGLRPLPIDLPTLRVEQTHGQWCVRDQHRVLFNFGLKADDARQAEAVIRKYGFTQVAAIGQGAPAMVVFLTSARDQALARTATVTPAPKEMEKKEPAKEVPVPKPDSPAARLLEKHPGVAFDLPVSAAVPGLRPSSPAATGAPLTPAGAHVAVPAAGAGPVDRLAFDWRQVQVRQDRDGWKLANGGQELARFAAERDARQALGAVQHYHLSERCRVGSAGGCAVFLASGQPPRGLLFGLPGESFNPDALVLRQVGEQYALCDGTRTLLRCGDRPEDAGRLLDLIRRNKADLLCRVGDPDTGLTVLVRSR
jgi:hypothetical protein